MTNYSFDDTIPATNNNPSTDQPGMLINNQSTKALLGVDHATFGINNGGSHLQASFYTNQSPSIGSALSILYPGARPSVYSNSTGSSATNTYLLNVDGTFPTSIIKACGAFADSSSTNTFTSQANCVSISYSTSPNRFIITLVSGVTTGNNVIVLLGRGAGTSLPNTYSFSSGVLTITSIGNGSVSFAVLQV